MCSAIIGASMLNYGCRCAISAGQQAVHDPIDPLTPLEMHALSSLAWLSHTLTGIRDSVVTSLSLCITLLAHACKIKHLISAVTHCRPPVVITYHHWPMNLPYWPMNLPYVFQLFLRWTLSATVTAVLPPTLPPPSPPTLLPTLKPPPLLPPSFASVRNHTLETTVNCALMVSTATQSEHHTSADQ